MRSPELILPEARKNLKTNSGKRDKGKGDGKGERVKPDVEGEKFKQALLPSPPQRIQLRVKWPPFILPSLV